MINYYYYHIFILIINSSTQNTVMLICLPSVKKKMSHPPPSHLSRQVENGCCFLDFIGHHLPRVSAINGYSNLIYLPEFLYIYNIYCIPTFILWHVSLYLSLSLSLYAYRPLYTINSGYMVLSSQYIKQSSLVFLWHSQLTG